MTRTKLDATELSAFEIIKCALSRGDFNIPAEQLISNAYELADLLYEEGEKRFAEMEKEEEELVVS